MSTGSLIEKHLHPRGSIDDVYQFTSREGAYQELNRARDDARREEIEARKLIAEHKEKEIMRMPVKVATPPKSNMKMVKEPTKVESVLTTMDSMRATLERLEHKVDSMEKRLDGFEHFAVETYVREGAARQKAKNTEERVAREKKALEKARADNRKRQQRFRKRHPEKYDKQGRWKKVKKRRR